MFVNPTAGDLHLVVNSATLANVIDQATAVSGDTDDWNELTRTAGSPTDIGADNSKSSSSNSAKAAMASVSTATNLDAAADATATATPIMTVATSSKAAKPTAILGGSQPVPGVVVAGPLPLTTARRNRAGQAWATVPWAAPALSSAGT
jgi:hypothetical protein